MMTSAESIRSPVLPEGIAVNIGFKHFSEATI